MREPIWSKHEIALLKQLYTSGVPLRSIAAQLNRSISAIRTRVQLEGMRRSNRLGANEITALQNQALACGIDPAHIPANPSPLKILIRLVIDDICCSKNLDELCSMGSSARNKAIQLLNDMGLIFADKYSSPREIILTRRAYQLRPEPSFADPAAVRSGALPTMTQLTDALDTWAAASCRNPASVDQYREFIIRQLINAESGDITPADFYSIFFDLTKIKPDNAEVNGTD